MFNVRYFTAWGWMVIALGLFVAGCLVGWNLSDYTMGLRGLM